MTVWHPDQETHRYVQLDISADEQAVLETALQNMRLNNNQTLDYYDLCDDAGNFQFAGDVKALAAQLKTVKKQHQDPVASFVWKRIARVVSLQENRRGVEAQ
jgi:hypothetical protein